MFKNYLKYLFLMVLFLSTMMVMSSNSWFMIWMALELNLMSFITLMINNKKKMSIESSIIYFLIQAISSTLLLLAILLISIKSYFFMKIYLSISKLMIISIMIKLGSAPFHFWIPLIMQNMTWNMNFILMTWQKIAPMIMLFYCINFMFLMIFIFLSSLIGSVFGLNQTSLKKIMAYSSINQISWLISSLMMKLNLWKIYLLIYSLISFSLINLMNQLKINLLNQLMNLNNFNNKKKMIFLLMNFLSMGGLPPLLGFFPKLILIFIFVKNNFIFLSIILILFSLINLFYYLRIIYSSLLLNFYKNNSLFMKLNFYKNSHNNNKFSILMIFFLSFFSLLMILFLLF